MNGKATTTPIISIVIPTYNRFDELLVTLEALSKQTLDKCSFEVVIVDDGSTDTTPEIATRSFAFDLVYVSQANQGSAAARNHGARVSRGEFLVFIDDDISLSPGYLQATLDVVDKDRCALCMGSFTPYLTEGSSTFAKLYPQVFPTVHADSSIDEEVPFTECTSNNLVVERSVFEDAGRWQDVLGDGPTLWGDVEFGYRAMKKGYQFVRVAQAKLVHRDKHMADLESAAKRAYHVSTIVPPLFTLHPGIEKHLPMFRDKHPIIWRQDALALILNKLIRQVFSSRPVMRGLEAVAPVLERSGTASRLLPRIYRWILSGYIYRGYRAGLRE